MKQFEDLPHLLRARARLAQTAPKRAAVLVPVIEAPEGPSLLLTRRTDVVSSHQGQVAFPGGRMEPHDPDAVANALREAEEEVGLHPSYVQVLGLLDDIPTVTGTTMVTPVVGRVLGAPSLRPQESEVARIFSIPIAELQRKERWRIEGVSWRGTSFPMFFFDHDGEVLWGMSAYVTLQLLSFLPGGAPHTVPEYNPGR